jgi:hypothetical protein
MRTALLLGVLLTSVRAVAQVWAVTALASNTLRSSNSLRAYWP